MNIQIPNNKIYRKNLVAKIKKISSMLKLSNSDKLSPKKIERNPLLFTNKLPKKIQSNNSIESSFVTLPLSKPHIITKEEQDIHDKYLKPLSLFNLPRYLQNEIENSRLEHEQALETMQLAKKLQFDAHLPDLQNSNFYNSLVLFPSKTIKNIEIYTEEFNIKASKGLIGRHLAHKKTLFSNQYSDNDDINPYIKYGVYQKNSKKKLKKKVNRKIDLAFTQYRKITNKNYRKRLQFLKKKQVKLQPKFFSKKKKKFKRVFKPKPKPLLPWIAQGRLQHARLKKALVDLYVQIKFNARKRRIGLLTRQNRKLIKQFRKNRKYGKFARFGEFSKFSRRYLFKKPSQFTNPRNINRIKRQSLYLQHKRLSAVNNVDVFKLKYMYILVIVWYLLLNISLPLYRNVINCEIWLTFFLKNLWVYQTWTQTNNIYLNYAITTGLQAHIRAVNIYSPARNALYSELQFFKLHQRLLSNKRNLNKNFKTLFRFKRRSKVRTFFRISPKLKNRKNRINKFNKRKKNKISKRLEPKEWLLVSKFVRTRYQHHFSSLFSNWKNIKKIHKYIDKHSHAWHQPYIITHPYYYTTRYKTFLYDNTFYK